MNEVSDAAERHAEREARATLKGVLRNLLEVRAQRAVMPDRESALARARRQGEIWGLDAAIAAVERRIR